MPVRLGLIAGLVMLSVTSSPAAQVPLSPRDALAALPRSVHNSEIRLDAVPGTAVRRLWININANEDNLRLYSPSGAQLDVDMQVSTALTPGASPLTIASFEALIPMTSLVQVAAARTVDGRVWGVPFRLQDTQLALLRAFVWQLIAVTDWRG